MVPGRTISSFAACFTGVFSRDESFLSGADPVFDCLKLSVIFPANILFVVYLGKANTHFRTTPTDSCHAIPARQSYNLDLDKRYQVFNVMLCT